MTGWIKQLKDVYDSLLLVTRELLGFVGGFVYVSNAGAAGTTFPRGTALYPSSTVANGITIAAANTLHGLHVDGTHTINTDISGYNFVGCTGPFAHTLITLAAGVVNTNCNFHHCIITGAANGIAYFETQCILFDLTGVDGFIRDSDLAGTITLADPSLGYIDMNNISTQQGPITIDCINLGAGDNLRIHNFAGTVTFTNLTAAATIRIYSSAGANIVAAASCTAGTLELHGDVANVTDGGGGITVTRYDLVGRAKGLDAIYDDVGTAITDIVTVDGKVDAQDTKLARIELSVVMWGGFDEITLKSAADPAALDVATKFTPDVPTGVTITRAFLIMKFREITCVATANYISTAGVVQVKKAAGAFLTGITIPIGTLDVALGAVAAGGVWIGDVDVKAQVEDGTECEFQLITLRSNADDLLIRDVQLGLQIYYTL